MTSPQWISAYVVSWYFRIHDNERKKLRNKLKGTPYLKQSDSKCSDKYLYYLYDMEYLIDGLGLKPIEEIPKRLIKS